MQQELNQASHTRITSIDIARGLVMILMTLDHVRASYAIQARNFLGNTSPLGPIDPVYAFPDISPLLFYLRWITNFCAPFFVFLAGTSIFLWMVRKGPTTSVSRYLVTRGIWVICANFIVVFPAPFLSEPYFNLGVLWAIGFSMLLMAMVIHCPKPILWAMGILIVCGHDLIQSTFIQTWPWQKLWSIAFFSIEFSIFNSGKVFVQYPIIPWFGFMLMGYLCGSVFLIQKNKMKTLLRIGLGLLLGFTILRYFEFYGDEKIWTSYAELWKNVASFLNTTKYPPSLQFFLFNIGVLHIAIACIEKYKIASKFLLVLGSTPMVFYIAHFLGARAMGVVIQKYTGPLSLPLKDLLLTPMGVIFSSMTLVCFLYPLCFYTKYQKPPWAK